MGEFRSFEVILSEDSRAREVDTYLSRGPGATIFHTLAWNRIVRDVFRTRFAYVVARDERGIAGAMPCHWVDRAGGPPICYSPPRLYETPYGGPVAADAGVGVELIRSAGCQRLGSAVNLTSSPESSNWVQGGAWRSVQPLETAYVDLRRPLEDVWAASLDGNRRNMIRKAERAGVEVRVAGPELVGVYHELARQMTERAAIRLHPLEYYRRVLETFGPTGQAVLLLAYADGCAQSGGIFLRFGRFAYYWHGASATSAPNQGQGELVQWRAIQWAHQAGCDWYDLVGIERDRLPHIARFKLGFSRDLVPFYSVAYVRLVDRVVRRLVRLARGRA